MPRSSYNNDPCHAQGKRNYSGSFELDSNLPKETRTSESDYDSDSDSQTQSSSGDSNSESELSDIPVLPRPLSHLLVSRRLSKQRQYGGSIDYSQLSESTSEIYEEEDSEDSEKEVDVEYVDPASRACIMARRRIRPSRARQRAGGRSQEQGGVEKKMEQRRNIDSLFQPQSPLVTENMKVCVAVCCVGSRGGGCGQSHWVGVSLIA